MNLFRHLLTTSVLITLSGVLSAEDSKCSKYVVDATNRSAPAADIESWETLIWPVSTSDFFERHYESGPLLIRRGDHQYWNQGFQLTTENLETLLETGRIVREDPLLLNPNSGSSQANCEAVRQGMDGIQGNFSGDIFHSYLNGATIVCNLIPAFWPPASRLLSQLPAATGYSWMANLYMTPTGAQGFSPHTDNTDGLIAQLFGSKHWAMFNTSMPLPYREDRVGRQQQPTHKTVLLNSQPDFEGKIEPGDLLVVPRGWVHSARAAGNGPSAHLTLSAVKVPSVAEFVLLMIRFFPVEMLPSNGAQFMHHILFDAIEFERRQPGNPWLRRSVPPLFSETRGLPALHSAVQQLMSKFKPMVQHKMAAQMQQNKDMAEGFVQCFEALSSASPARAQAITAALGESASTTEYVEKLHRLGLAQTERIDSFKPLEPGTWLSRTATPASLKDCGPLQLCLYPEGYDRFVIQEVPGLRVILEKLISQPVSTKFQLQEIDLFGNDVFARICLVKIAIKFGILSLEIN